MNNPDVVKVQRRLNELGYVGKDGKPLEVDGNFGTNTDYAVRRYQSNNGLKVDGSVDPITWKSLGFKFDNDYERGTDTGTPEAYGKGPFVELNGFKIKDGIYFGDAQVGMAGAGGDYEYFEWSLDAVSAEAKAGLSFDLLGFSADASGVKVDGGVKIPIPFTDKKIFVGGEATVFSIGAHTYYDKKEGKIKIGISLGAGIGTTIGIGD